MRELFAALRALAARRGVSLTALLAEQELSAKVMRDLAKRRGGTTWAVQRACAAAGWRLVLVDERGEMHEL